MAPIASFSGLASGFQWRDMVDQIIRLESARRLNPITTSIARKKTEQSDWKKVNDLLVSFGSAARSLQDASAFGNFTVTVPKSPTTSRDLLAVTANSQAQAGTYKVEVQSLATATKLNSTAQASATTDLGLPAGDIWVNGKKVTVEATDTLTTLRDKINGTGSGVTATILSTAADQHHLVLTASETGSRGVELVDSQGGTLQSLGVLGSGTSANKSADGTATQTQRFSDSSLELATVLGVNPPPAVTTVDVNGVKITVDFANDTLLSVMNKINNAGGQAEIVTETVNGRTMSRLSVQGTVQADAAATDPAASQRIVELMGFQKKSPVNQVSAGSDSKVVIDGLSVERRTNQISDVVQGLTFDLKAAEAGTTLDITVAQDRDKTVEAVKAFVDAFNAIDAFDDMQREKKGSLYANGSMRSMLMQLKNGILSEVGGLSAGNTYNRLTMVGIEFDRHGSLQLNETKLRDAMATNNAHVQELFSRGARASTSAIAVLGVGPNTIDGTHAVEITQAAARASITGTAIGAAGYLATDLVSDTLTITDSVSGKTINYEVRQGTSAATIRQELNDLFSAQGLLLSASESGGALQLSAKRYGSASSFSVSGTATTGLGLTAGTYSGVDVAGTIGGVAATGVGEVLTGAAGSAVDGLSIAYAGTATGAIGSVTVSQGVGGMLTGIIDPITDTSEGDIKRLVDALGTSIKRLDSRVSNVKSSLDRQEQMMIQKFVAMESLMAQINQQSGWLLQSLQPLQPQK